MRENEPNGALLMQNWIETEPINGRSKLFFLLIIARLYNSIDDAVLGCNAVYTGLRLHVC